jgi:hypothetical protein
MLLIPEDLSSLRGDLSAILGGFVQFWTMFSVGMLSKHTHFPGSWVGTEHDLTGALVVLATTRMLATSQDDI